MAYPDRGGKKFGGKKFGGGSRPSFGGGDRGGFKRGGDRPSFGDRGGRPSFGRDRGGFGGPKEMFDAVCSNCGNDCQVPFRPNGKKPVLCSDCFGKNKGGFDGGRDAGRPAWSDKPKFTSGPATSGGVSKEQFDALVKKVDKILEILNTAIEESDEEDFDDDDDFDEEDGLAPLSIMETPKETKKPAKKEKKAPKKAEPKKKGKK